MSSLSNLTPEQTRARAQEQQKPRKPDSLFDVSGKFLGELEAWLATRQTSLPIFTGRGTPEGVVKASIGSLFLRLDGGAGTSLYAKESGTGATGWVGK